jgi:hypothetical protein
MPRGMHRFIGVGTGFVAPMILRRRETARRF